MDDLTIIPEGEGLNVQNIKPLNYIEDYFYYKSGQFEKDKIADKNKSHYDETKNRYSQDKKGYYKKQRLLYFFRIYWKAVTRNKEVVKFYKIKEADNTKFHSKNMIGIVRTHYWEDYVKFE